MSASSIRHELQVLKQMAKIAYRNDWIKKDNMWEDVKIKNIAGQNVKIVSPLSIKEQKDVLEALFKSGNGLHDAILFLLLTGIRIGELEGIKLEGNVIKVSGTKTESANRIIPACKTLVELFRRGKIFRKGYYRQIKRNMGRSPFTNMFKGIHPHRFRHTFAVNKLLAEIPLQMVSYRLGHKNIGLTADLYGKFMPEYFKIGFEEAVSERKEWTDYLENRYFSDYEAQ
jgi:integrase